MFNISPHLIKKSVYYSTPIFLMGVFVLSNSQKFPNNYPVYNASSSSYLDEIYFSANSDFSTASTLDEFSELPSDPDFLESDFSSTDQGLRDSDAASLTDGGVAFIDSATDYTVSRGDGAIQILSKAGIESTDIKNIVYNSSAPRSVFSLSAGDIITVNRVSDKLTSLDIRPKKRNYFYHFKADENRRFIFSKESYTRVEKINSYAFSINSSLYHDGANAGLSDTEISQVVEILKFKSDFNHLKAGEFFDVLVSRSYYNDVVSGESKVLAVKYLIDGSKKFAFYYSSDGNEGYFDQNGVSVTPTFRRHPVDGPRVTSLYNPNRMHPVLHYVRPHRGTDYGGFMKPIHAISDGTIVFAGKRGSFGNAVIIKHPHGVQTLSAHMNNFEKGVKRGAKVDKGQVLGYIGKTGIVTGPHLHFEMKINGKYVDSLKAKLPMESKVSDLDDFRSHVGEVLSKTGWSLN